MKEIRTMKCADCKLEYEVAGDMHGEDWLKKQHRPVQCIAGLLDKVDELEAEVTIYRHRWNRAVENHKLDGQDILEGMARDITDGIDPNEPMAILTESRRYWLIAKLSDIMDGKGRGGIQS